VRRRRPTLAAVLCAALACALAVPWTGLAALADAAGHPCSCGSPRSCVCKLLGDAGDSCSLEGGGCRMAPVPKDEGALAPAAPDRPVVLPANPIADVDPAGWTHSVPSAAPEPPALAPPSPPPRPS
jgi:hypothetical protein